MKARPVIRLGRYVRVTERSDGTHNVFMSVPSHLRPDGWPATIKLPEQNRKRRSLEDPAFRKLVEADIQLLNDRLDKRRLSDEVARSDRRTLVEVVDIYINRDDFKSLSASRQYRNRRSALKIVEWSASRQHPDISKLSARDVDDFLSRYPTRRATRFDMRSTWNMLFKTAKYARWITESPLERGNWERQNPRNVRIWTMKDVESYSAMARQMKQPGLAALITTLMETGQRLGDLMNARWDRDFTGDRFVIRQSKTSRVVNIPIPVWLRNLIRSARVPGSNFVFNDADTDTGFKYGRLRVRFNEVREALAEPGEKLLYLRTLRHSCVCRLMEIDMPPAQIAAITGHRLLRVHTILEKYFPDRWGFAERGMRHAFEARGGAPEDFGELQPLDESNWTGHGQDAARYATPEYTESNVERLLAAKSGQHRNGARYPSIQDPFAP